MTSSGNSETELQPSMTAATGRWTLDVPHPGDFFDEAPRDAFFLPPGARKLDCHEELSTMLDADESVAFIVHLARECTAHYAWINSTMYYRHMYPRVVQLPMTHKRSNVFFVESSNLDAMLGRTDECRQVVQQAMDTPGVELVVLVGSCIAEMTGMHLQGMLREEGELRGIPTVFLELTVDENTPMDEFWQGLVQVAGPQREPDPQAVNLVGYAAEDSEFTSEAAAVLSRAGLRLNAVLVPSFRTAAARRFSSAICTAINTAEQVSMEFALARQELAFMRYLDLSPPFGPRASLVFYSRLVAGVGRDPAAVLEPDPFAPWRPIWRRFRSRAAQHAVTVVVGQGDEHNLISADALYGLDLVTVLREMGFGVELLCTPDDDGTEASSRAGALRRHFFHTLDGDPGVRVATLDPDEPLESRLAQLEASLVFTEFPPDNRVLRAGKLYLQPRDFEIGFGGAVRTIARLVRLAEGRSSPLLSHPLIGDGP